jgi:arsenate reductase
MNMARIAIYHNPACGTSRNTLALIRNSGVEPEVIEYLLTPPTKAKLHELLLAMGIPARELLREKGTPYAELGLADAKWSDDALLDILPDPQRAAFNKEDGEAAVNAEGQRV